MEKSKIVKKKDPSKDKKKINHQINKEENKQVIKKRKTGRSLKPVINMMSKADMVKGQGVLAVYEEQVQLVKDYLKDDFDVLINAGTKADIVHYHTINPEFIITLANKKLEGITIGYVHFLPETVEDSIDLPEIVRDVFNFYLIQFYKMMDYLVVVNPYFIDLLENYGINRENVFYIPNFVSSDTFYPKAKEEIKDIRFKYGLDKDKFTVLGVGQLQTRKGVMDFVEIANRMPDVQFVWAGGFSFSVISEGYKEIKKIVDNPPANIKFLGIVEREEMNDIYNIGDVMFLPSYAELFPMSILEAMSCHKPILIRDLDIYPDILFDFYLRANDNQGFIDELNKLINDSNYYNEAVLKAKKGSEFYAREHIAQMWKDVYHKALREGNMMRKAKRNSKKEARKKGLD